MQETYGDLHGCSKIGSGVSLAVEPRSRNGSRRIHSSRGVQVHFRTLYPWLGAASRGRLVLKAVRGVLSEAGLSWAVDSRRGGEPVIFAPLRAAVSGRCGAPPR